MKRALAGLLAILMALTGPGCAALRSPSHSTFAHAAPPPTAPMPQAGNVAAWNRYLAGIPAGTRVRITTTTGVTFDGVFLGVSQGRVGFRPLARGTGGPQWVEVSSLAQIGWNSQGSKLPWIVLLIAGIVVILVLAAQAGQTGGRI